MNTVIYASDENLKDNPVDILNFSQVVYDFLVDKVLKTGWIFKSVDPITHAEIKAFSLNNPNTMYLTDDTIRTRTIGFNLSIGVEQGRRNPRLRIDINGPRINSTLKKLDHKTRNLMRERILDVVHTSYRELS